MKAVILNYGVGNLYSLSSNLKRVGFDVVVSRARSDINSADLIVLPGVGAHGTAMKILASIKDIREIIKERWSLGICLGMHLLFEESEESGEKGLGLLKGRVVKLNAPKVPHMGWNEVKGVKDDELVNEGYYYFAHSYVVNESEDTLAITEYGRAFPSIVRKENIIGVQFHPEKSSRRGHEFLRKVYEVVKR